MPKALTVRFRLDFDDRCSVGVGKIELLERIALAGSISQAARDMHMSYRRAWLLIEDMKLNFDRPVVRSISGGHGGGGAELTEFGERLIAAYRSLEAQIQSLAADCLSELSSHTRGARSKQTVHATTLKRKVSAAG